MRNESAFNAPSRAVTYRAGKEERNALRKTLVGSGSLSTQGKCTDKFVMRVLLGKAYGDLIGRHEWSAEMVIAFILPTVRENSMEMVDVEFASHGSIRHQLRERGGAV